MKKYLLFLSVSIFNLAYTQTNRVINPSALFLLICPDARAGGMGDAGGASTPDVYSSHWNASKLSFTEKNSGVSFSYTPWLREIENGINLFDFFLYKRIGNKNTFAVSGRYLNTNTDGKSFNSPGTIYGGLSILPKEYSVSVSYSRLISRKISAAFSGKYLNSILIDKYWSGEYTGSSFAGDLSFYRRDSITVKSLKSVLSSGITISNIGKKISYSQGSLTGSPQFLPQHLRVGASYKINTDSLNSIEFVVDVNKLLVPTLPEYDWSTGEIVSGMDPGRSAINALYSSFYDAPNGFKEELNEINIATGVEYWYHKTVAARAGYFYEHTTKGRRKYVTAGIGIRYGGMELSGSYIIPTEKKSPLKNTWRVSLSLEFDTLKKHRGEK